MIVGLTVQLSSGQVFFSEKELNIDSLENLVDNGTVIQKLDALKTLSQHYKLSDKQKCLELAKQAYDLSEQMGDPTKIGESAFHLGTAYHHLGNYPMAIRYALDSWEEAQNSEDLAFLLKRVELVVMVYLYSGNYDLAIAYTEAFYNELDISHLPAAALFDIYIRVGWVYTWSRQYEKAISFFDKAHAFRNDTIHIEPERVALNASHIADCYMNLDKYDSALRYSLYANELRKKYKIGAVSNVVLYVGHSWMGVKELDSAEVYYRQALDIYTQNDEIYFKGAALNQLGLVAEDKGNFNEAILHYNNAIASGNWVVENKALNKTFKDEKDYWFSSAQVVPSYVENMGLRLLRQTHKRLADLYSSLGQFEKAYPHLEAFMKVEHQSSSLKSNKDVLELNTKYETERKEQRVLLLEKENDLAQNRLTNTRLLFSGIIVFILILSLFIFLYIRQNRIKEAQEKTNLQNKLFRLQLNPHFLYNALAGIQQYIVTEDADKASIYLSKFSNVIRKILDSSVEDFIPLDDEINACENYLALQQLRFAEKLSYTIEVDLNLDIENIYIPPMLVQPFVENAIDHGIKYLPGKGTLKVTYKKMNETVTIEVEDNGIGREEARKKLEQRDPKHKSMATRITQERIDVYNKKLKGKISFNIIDLKDENLKPCGTLVRFSIPFS
jgi:tetratricopeptide (TPR) repeat protein